MHNKQLQYMYNYNRNLFASNCKASTCALLKCEFACVLDVWPISNLHMDLEIDRKDNDGECFALVEFKERGEDLRTCASLGR
jgi:hypothetical protein